MIRQADILAHCRQGLDTEEIIAILSAITSPMHMDNKVCLALDVCNDKLMDLQEQAREAALWEQDDKDCRREQSLVPAASIPSFLVNGATA